MAHGHTHWKPLGDGTLTTEDASEGLGHILDLSILRNVLLILLFLTVVTVWASRIDFGSWNIVIAIVIASIKALIVAMYFMHLKFEGATILMYAIYPLIILFLLIGGTLGDVSDRVNDVALPAGMVSAPVKAKMNLPDAHGGAHSGEHGEAHH